MEETEVAPVISNWPHITSFPNSLLPIKKKKLYIFFAVSGMEPTSKACALPLNHILSPPFKSRDILRFQWFMFALGSLRGYFKLSVLAVE